MSWGVIDCAQMILRETVWILHPQRLKRLLCIFFGICTYPGIVTVLASVVMTAATPGLEPRLLLLPTMLQTALFAVENYCSNDDFQADEGGLRVFD